MNEFGGKHFLHLIQKTWSISSHYLYSTWIPIFTSNVCIDIKHKVYSYFRPPIKNIVLLVKNFKWCSYFISFSMAFLYKIFTFYYLFHRHVLPFRCFYTKLLKCLSRSGHCSSYNCIYIPQRIWYLPCKLRLSTIIPSFNMLLKRNYDMLFEVLIWIYKMICASRALEIYIHEYFLSTFFYIRRYKYVIY